MLLVTKVSMINNIHNVALEVSYVGKLEEDRRKLSVESSFKLDLPPHLIIPSASIKLLASIGQGVFLPVRLLYYTVS